jgi:hypothetical protein
MKKTKFLAITAAIMLLALCGSCDRIDNKSIPSFIVRIDLGNYATWNAYGVHGMGEYQIFNREKKIPANFPYNVNTYTGFGGVLLFMGQDLGSGGAVPMAFDLSCPVEHNAEVTVSIDPTTLDAVCIKCKSHYDVLLGGGGPKSGMAIDYKVGLNVYQVRPTVNGGYIISNY